MTPGQQAEARSRAYALLAGLWADGLTEKRLLMVQQTPLADHLPAPLDLDRLAAAHHTAWTLELQPYAGVFLDTEADTGGAAQRLLSDCRAAGFSPRTDDTRPDHISIALAALSFLCGAEADAYEDHRTDIVTQLRTLQETMLDRHLLPWLPPLWLADHGDGFWRAVFLLTAELLVAHRGAAGPAWPAPTLPEGLLADRKTGLWRVAGVMATPALSGVFLTRTDLQQIGRSVGVPRGFGARRQMLVNLLRNAAEYGDLPDVADRLGALWAARCAAYASLGERHPALAPHAAVWQHQASVAGRLWGALKQGALQAR